MLMATVRRCCGATSTQWVTGVTEWKCWERYATDGASKRSSEVNGRAVTLACSIDVVRSAASKVIRWVAFCFQMVTAQRDLQRAAKEVATRVACDIPNTTFGPIPRTSNSTIAWWRNFTPWQKRRRERGDEPSNARMECALELRHTSTHNPFLVHRSVKKTSFERRHNRISNKKLIPMGGTAVWKMQGPNAGNIGITWSSITDCGKSNQHAASLCTKRHVLSWARTYKDWSKARDTRNSFY